MPAIKSPGKLLQIWKQKTHAYLKVNGATALEPQESSLDKKVCHALERLRKVAADGMAAEAQSDFTGARDTALDSLEKLRRLFKPKKTQPKVKIFYLDMSRMILVLRQLELAELDPHEDGADSLDDVDAEALERHEQEHEAQIDAALAAGQIPAAPPSKAEAAPKTASPVVAEVGESSELKSRLAAVSPRLHAVLEAKAGNVEGMQKLFDMVKSLIQQHKFGQALLAVRELERLVGEAEAATVAARRSGPGLAGWQTARNAAVGDLRKLAAAIAHTKDPEAPAALILLDSMMKNLTPSPSTRASVDELERYIATDDNFSAVEEPNDLCTIRVREPLLQALQMLKGELTA